MPHIASIGVSPLYLPVCLPGTQTPVTAHLSTDAGPMWYMVNSMYHVGMASAERCALTGV